MTTSDVDLQSLVQRFDGPGVSAIALMGSYARGDAGLYSDIDLVRFVDGRSASSTAGSYLVDGQLLVVSDVTPAQVEEWFTRPEVAVNVIAGVRMARPLSDPDGVFEGIRIRARAFSWDTTMQERANAWASQQMVGWIEEVHKGLEGLRRGDIGRMLHARFGCTWGLSRVMQVQRGVLITGDNAFYDQVGAAVGNSSEWVRLRRTAFGIEDEGRRPPSLRAQVIAGLRLYAVTAGLLKGALRPADAPLIAETVQKINQALGGAHAEDADPTRPQSVGDGEPFVHKGTSETA